jgi:hypothetical protein
MAEDAKQKLIEIMAQIKGKPESLDEFAADPVGYLKAKGLDAEGLTLTPQDVTDADLALVAGGACYTLGYYACYTEG